MDEAIQKLIDRHGHFGYSGYFMIVELLHTHGKGDTLIMRSSRVASYLRSRVDSVKDLLNTLQMLGKCNWEELGKDLRIQIPKFRERQAKLRFKNPPKMPEESPKHSIDYKRSIRLNKEKENLSSDSEEIRLSIFLFEKIRERDPGFKEPNIQKWGLELNKIINLDHRTFDQINSVIVWAQEHKFWQSNILCPTKLRQQFSKLFQQMNQEKEMSRPGRVKIESI